MSRTDGTGPRPERGDQVAELAHDLRNQLGSLRVALAVLDAEPSDPDVRDRQRRILRRGLAYLERLAEELERAGALEGAEPRPERIDLCTLVRNAVEARQPEFAAGGIRVTLEIPSEPLSLHADPFLLTRAVDNLLANARKFTPDGGRVGVRLVRDGAGACLTVRDDGRGISPELLGRLFERGVQAPGSGGRGLGLWIVRTVAEQHGGVAEAQSDGDGHGAEIALRLPLDSTVETRPARRPGSRSRTARPAEPGGDGAVGPRRPSP